MVNSEEIPLHREASRKREIIALVIFLVLIILGGVLLIGYFGTGRTWSVAATIVDDNVGHLDDYSVVVFNGSAEPATYNSNSDETNSDRNDESTMRSAYDTQSETDPKKAPYSVIMDAYHRAEKIKKSTKGVVFASDVRDLYEIKGAHAITIDISNPDYYMQPTVIHAGDKAFGVFSVSSYTSRAQLKSILTELNDEGADNIICIAPRMAMLSSSDGISVVILTDGEEAAKSYIRNNPRGNTLVVGSPEKGNAGVVLFSSNNVPSFKPVEDL